MAYPQNMEKDESVLEASTEFKNDLMVVRTRNHRKMLSKLSCPLRFQVSLFNDYFAQYVRAEARANLNEWAHSILVQHDGAGRLNAKGDLDHLSHASKGCSNSVKFKTGTFEINPSLGEPGHDCFEIDLRLVRALADALEMPPSYSASTGRLYYGEFDDRALTSILESFVHICYAKGSSQHSLVSTPNMFAGLINLVASGKQAAEAVARRFPQIEGAALLLLSQLVAYSEVACSRASAVRALVDRCAQLLDSSSSASRLFLHAALLLNNLAAGKASIHTLGGTTVLPVLVRLLRSSDARKMQRAINILFHMSACKGARAVFATHEAIPVLKKIVRSPASLGRPLRDKALVTLAALTLFNVLPLPQAAVARGVRAGEEGGAAGGGGERHEWQASEVDRYLRDVLEYLEFAWERPDGLLRFYDSVLPASVCVTICTSYRPAALLYTLNQMLLHPATLTHVSKAVALRITELACSTLERIRFTPPDMQVLKYLTVGTKISSWRY
jgi:hypothetical protein